MPSPAEAQVPEAFHRDTGEPFRGQLPAPLALSFKVHSKVRRGVRSDLTFVRIYRGTVEVGTRLWNDRAGATEEVQSVLRIHASDVEHIGRAVAGDIVALGGLKATGTGDTLAAEGTGLRLEPPRVPTPVLGFLVEPRRDDERVVLGDALEQLAREDPSLRVAEDRASGQWLVEGMGELHLDIALARLGSEFGVEPRTGPPRVAFRESVRMESLGEGRVDRDFGGERAHVEVALRLEPASAAWSPVELGEDVRRGPGEAPFDAEVWGAIRAALRAEAMSGPLEGHPLSGVMIRMTRAVRIDGDAHEAAWTQAAVAALREALKAVVIAGGVQPLEPWMSFVVDTPVDVSSGVIGDLNSRHANMEEIIATGADSRRVTGTAPLRTLIGYSTELRSLSKGRATFGVRAAGLRPTAGEAASP